MSLIFRPPSTDDEFKTYFNFRWQLLRKPLGLPKGSEQDHLENTSHHIGAYDNENILGVGRIQIEDENSARIRYMAVSANSRKQGIGSKILLELERFAIDQKIKTCWLLAREDVVPFT